MSGLISVDQAISLILEHRPKMDAETVPLHQALGRTLAAPLVAKLTQPPASVSAMDGYAVRLADVSEPGANLKVIGDAPAGAPFSGTLGSNEAVRIFTGGHVPTGADHILIQETVTRDGDVITCDKAYANAEHIRAAGRDFSKDDSLLETGKRLGPAEISVAAAANHAELSVLRQPTVGLISNGNELKPPSSELLQGEIVNSNPYGLGALVQIWGGKLLPAQHAADSVDAILEALEALSPADIIVPIGGASVGDHDHMRRAFVEAGFNSVFEKIAVKPGKPTWFSKRSDQSALGLPGNPASAFVCAHLFLRILMGASEGLELASGQLAAPLPANGRRETFMRAEAKLNDGGVVTLHPAIDQDSSLITPFLGSNALIRRIPQAEPKGTSSIIEFLRIGAES
ncbi:MAG: molybdopterin molybdotransferase MoeA [Pseudomonadota bacterium]